MKRLILIIAAVLLVAAGVFCGFKYYFDVYLPNKEITDAEKEQREYYEQLKPDSVSATGSADADGDNGEYQSGRSPSLEKLEAANNDSVGWITVDGTVIDYPVVQAEDNDFYLDHGVDGQYNNGIGCPFLDYRCKGDFSGFNSIVYAHHIQGYRALFSDITLYSDREYMEQHPAGTLVTKNGAHRVRFFAYMTIPNPSFAYNTDPGNKDGQNQYLGDIFENAEYTSAYTLEELKKNDNLRLLLLSTCSYEFWNARGVLAGVIE